MSLFQELKRRNVFRTTAGYVVLSWLLLQIADLLMDMLGLPEIWGKAIFGLLLIGIIPVVLFSWIYEMTPEGLKREAEVSPDTSITTETGQKLNITIIVLLVIAIGVYTVDNFILSAPRDAGVAATAQSGSVASGELPVIAVLPLQALSSAEEGEFLAAGLHDDLLTRLARLQAFRVISRTSVMEYAGTTKNIREIGAELGADYILEGGLQAIGGNVRINAQLINATTDEHLWAETFDGALTAANLFDLQSDIAGAIAEAMHATLSPEEVEQLNSIPTDNIDAYNAYLRGLSFLEILTQPAIKGSVASFAEASELDPQFAEAWANLSKSLSRQYWETGAEDGVGADDSIRDSALAALNQAKALAPNHVETLVAEAYYHYYGFRDYATALEYVGLASAHAPNDVTVKALRAYLYRRLGRMSEAADGLMEALELDPNSASLLARVVLTLIEAHRCTEAARFTNLAQDRFPDNTESDLIAALNNLLCKRDPATALEYGKQMSVTTFQHWGYVDHFYTMAGDYEGAIDISLKALETFGDRPAVRLAILNNLADSYRRSGQEQKALETIDAAGDIIPSIQNPAMTELAVIASHAALRGETELTYELGQRLLKEFPDDAYRYPDFALWMSILYVSVGLEDQGLELLENTVEKYQFEQELILDMLPEFKTLLDNPRFKALVASVDVS